MRDLGAVRPANVAAMTVLSENDPETLARLLRRVIIVSRTYARSQDVESVASETVAAFYVRHGAAAEINAAASAACRAADVIVRTAYAVTDSLETWAAVAGEDMTEAVVRQSRAAGLPIGWAPRPGARYTMGARDEVAAVMARVTDRATLALLRTAADTYRRHMVSAVMTRGYVIPWAPRDVPSSGPSRTDFDGRDYFLTHPDGDMTNVSTGEGCAACGLARKAGAGITLVGILAHVRGVVDSDAEYHRVTRAVRKAVKAARGNVDLGEDKRARWVTAVPGVPLGHGPQVKRWDAATEAPTAEARAAHDAAVMARGPVTVTVGGHTVTAPVGTLSRAYLGTAEAVAPVPAERQAEAEARRDNRRAVMGAVHGPLTRAETEARGYWARNYGHTAEARWDRYLSNAPKSDAAPVAEAGRYVTPRPATAGTAQRVMGTAPVGTVTRGPRPLPDTDAVTVRRPGQQPVTISETRMRESLAARAEAAATAAAEAPTAEAEARPGTLAADGVAGHMARGPQGTRIGWDDAPTAETEARAARIAETLAAAPSRAVRRQERGSGTGGTGAYGAQVPARLSSGSGA